MKTVNVPRGVLVRLFSTIGGFYSKFGHWPDGLELESSVLAQVVCVHLTPAGLFILQSRIKLKCSKEGTVVALGRGDSEKFDYAELDTLNEEIDTDKVMQWIGLAYDSD